MKNFILNSMGYIGFGFSLVWFIILVLKNIQSGGFLEVCGGFLKEYKKIRTGKILACLFVFGIWLSLFLFFQSSVITRKENLVGKIIVERTIQIVPNVENQQDERYQEFLDKKNNMELY